MRRPHSFGEGLLLGLGLLFLAPLWLALFGAQALAAAFGARRTDDADPHARLSHPTDYDLRMR